MVGKALFLALGLLLGGTANAEYSDSDALCDGTQVIVQLFEWSYDDIAKECEDFLTHKQYCGVQISPPEEHIPSGAWWARYQPVSYQLTSRSGNREQLENMARRCNAVGVSIIADMVINHMSDHATTGIGTAGSSYDGPAQSYPGVPFSYLDFHQPYCDINNYQDANNVRNCYLGGLNDLDHSKDYVRNMIAGYFNDLIGLGVRGFRIDASKHMWPGDLSAILDLVMDVDGARPLVIHEVIGGSGEAVSASEYTGVGKVTEFGAARWYPCMATQGFSCMASYPNGLLDGLHALTFVDNHDTQRNSNEVLTYKDDYWYKVATAFNLGHEYGFKRVMSSYSFTDTNTGPPSTEPCSEGWVCEHRWSTIGDLVQFTNAVSGTGITNYQNQGDALGFGRGNLGFIAMGNLNGKTFSVPVPDGEYCDVVHECQQSITVSGGRATIRMYQDNDPVVAFCVGCTANTIPGSKE